jgi:hypothetical protein
VALYWNREDEPGIWVVSANGDIERPLIRGLREPLGWSTDGKWIYATVRETSDPTAGISKTIVRIPFAGGSPQPWLALPIDENASTCAMSADATHLACIPGVESDVWMIDDFDQLLPR